MNNPIDITPVIPLGMRKEHATKFAENVAKTMRSMWSAEGGPITLKPEEFIYTALNCFRLPESKRVMADKMRLIFSEKIIEKIIESQNHFVTFTFNGESVTVNSKTPQPA